MVFISLVAFCFFCWLTLYYLIEIRENYKGWTSYFKLIQPISIITLAYMQTKGKWVFKQQFIITDEAFNWKLRVFSGSTIVKWVDIDEVKIENGYLLLLIKTKKKSKLI